MQVMLFPRLKSVYAKLLGALVAGALFLLIGSFFLYSHQQYSLEEIRKREALGFSKGFKEFLRSKTMPLEGYLQGASLFELDRERVEAMWRVWERALAGMEGIGYDAVFLFDSSLLPVATKSLIKDVSDNDLLDVIPKESLFLEYPVFTRYFTRLPDGRVAQVFSSPLRSAYAARGAEGYLVAIRVWSGDDIMGLERVSNHKISLIPQGGSIQGYDLLYPLEGFYGNEVANVGVRLDRSLTTFIGQLVYSQMTYSALAGIVVSLGVLFLLFTSVLIPLRRVSKVLEENDRTTLKELLAQEDEFGKIAKTIQRFFKQNILLEQYRGAIDSSFIVSKGDLKGNITYVNDQFCQISGYSREELLGKNHNIVRHPDNTKEFFAMLWKRIRSGRIWSGVIKNRTKQGEDYYVRAVIVPLMNDEGEIEEYLSIRTDITELYEQMQMIIQQTTDLLTGLPNKQQLLHDLEEGTQERCLMFININRFRGINDSYGYKVGDSLIYLFASRLGGLIPIGSNLYRLGGDEFAILIEADEEKGDKGGAEALALEIFEDLEETPFYAAETEIILSARISSACGTDLIYQKCDMAMNYAKINNLSYVDFDSNGQIREELERSKAVTRMVQEAIRSDFIQAYGQKIVSARDPKRYKVETLMRIVDDTGKITSPFIFLEQAKTTRLYPKLTRIMMAKVFEAFRDNDVEFSINLTFEDILDRDTTELILESLRSVRFQNRVTVELVESEQISSNEEINNFLKEVKMLGCKISIDDFGSGYSNFDYILKIGADFIKIDGTLIKNIDTDKNSYVTVKTIVTLAKELGIGVIAEFIHSQAVMDVVVDLGVDYLQGYHLHQPQRLDSSFDW